MNAKLLLIGLTAVTVLLSTGCGSNDSNDEKSTQSSEERDFNHIVARPEVLPRLELGHPFLVDLADKIQVPSRVTVDEERTAHIGSYITGRVTDMFVILGDYVKPGQPLARVTSPDLTNSQLAYLRALSREVVTSKAYERARHLLAADAIPVAEVERRQSELEIAQAELAAATDQLRLFGLGDAELKTLNKKRKVLPWLDIKATREGYVIARNVLVGQVVQPSDPLFQIADLSHVWVVGDVPEQIARDVELDQHVEIQVPALNQQLDGIIIFVSDTVNRLTRTVMTRVMVENPERKLKPDMMANMHITDSDHKVLVVPESAVVRELNQDYVFVALTDNEFQRVPVELAKEVANLRPIVNGLTIEQRIVTSGAFHLDSERKLAELE
ncbi:MAG: efflux transporter periplasmic adaptor subunit [Proteobacteria bacterium SG_bin4]|nr:MAG: efflux transporter periplasmic adaptor subunit [Proteobacteria bacterium SG_bin4]